MKRKLMLLVGLITSSLLFAQSNQSIDSSWTLDTQVKGISAYYKIVKCNGADGVMLAFDNQNPKPVSIVWGEEVIIDDILHEGLQKVKTYILPKGKTIQNGCPTSDFSILFIPIKDFGQGKEVINKFHFKNIQINQ